MSHNFDNWLPTPRFLLRKYAINSILNQIDLIDKKCLEIGFGSGEVLKLLASKKANVAGFDFSEDAVKVAHDRINNFQNKHKITITTNIDDLKHGSFDIVLAFEVLEHIEDDDAVFEEWLKYLKPGGRLILSVPAHMRKWGDSDIWAGHYRRYEKSDLIEMCKKHHTLIVNLWSYGYPLTIILDKFLHASKKNEVKIIKSNKTSKKELSKKSGIKRDNKLFYRLLSNNILLYPFFILQRLFYKKDAGSGYILHIQKQQ